MNAPVTRRWTEQRWLIDNVIRSVGIDWDQPRSINYNAPCGPEANADFAAIRERLAYSDMPDGLRGLGSAFIVTGLMSLAFIVFARLGT